MQTYLQQNIPNRNNFKWAVPEILRLQREYELLELPIDQIAEKHQRTPKAIICKLVQEGFADYEELQKKSNAKKYL